MIQRMICAALIVCAVVGHLAAQNVTRRDAVSVSDPASLTLDISAFIDAAKRRLGIPPDKAIDDMMDAIMIDRQDGTGQTPVDDRLVRDVIVEWATRRFELELAQELSAIALESAAKAEADSATIRTLDAADCAAVNAVLKQRGKAALKRCGGGGL